MARKRFNADEKAILTDGKGTPIEWLNTSRWHPGTLLSNSFEIDGDRWQYVMIENHATTKSVRNGQTFRAYPGSIRRRPTDA